MKAQLSIDFVLSLVIFIGVVAYVLLQTLAYQYDFLKEIKKQKLYAKAYALSEGLLSRWMDEKYNLTNLVSLVKIKNDEQACNSNYPNFKNSIGIDVDFGFYVFNSSNDLIASCSSASKKSLNLTRFARSENDYLKILVEV